MDRGIVGLGDHRELKWDWPPFLETSNLRAEFRKRDNRLHMSQGGTFLVFGSSKCAKGSTHRRPSLFTNNINLNGL